MKNIQRVAGLIGLLLLAAFFLPYVLKMREFDLGLILVGGVALAAADYYSSLR